MPMRPIIGEGANEGAASSSRAADTEQAPAYRTRHRRGKVVAVASFSDKTIVCTLHPNVKGEQQDREDGVVLDTDTLLKAKPTDHRYSWFLIQINDVTRRALDLPGKLDKYQLWPVKRIGWKETSTLPLGRLFGECLGQAGDMKAEEQHALMANDLDDHDVDFKDELLDEVDDIVTEARRNFEDEVKKRHDLRRKRIFTIDPATAKDLDDAIHVDVDEERQEAIIGVHIADVGHFVKVGSLVDTEAQFRTTSVYLTGRVLPMLPHALCNHLCSLNPNEPKLSFSAFFRLKLDTGELVETERPPWFEKTVISSCCRLNYDEVQRVLDGETIDEPPVYGDYKWEDIKKDIFLLYDVCGKVRRGRFTGGALSISKQKMIFHTRQSEDGRPTGYHLEDHSASHWIIEELMLLANRCVATYLAKSSHWSVSVLRKHERPEPKKADELAKMLKDKLGLEFWEAGSAGDLYKSCQEIYRKYGEMMGLCVEMLVMRSGMQQAEYFVYGPHDDQEEGAWVTAQAEAHHFALNFDFYTHFTSPIRRYPDVMVHRVLLAVLQGEAGREPTPEQDGYQNREDAEMQLVTCNEKKRSSRRTQEQLDAAVFCIYLRKMQTWFYTIGTVMKFSQERNEGSPCRVTVYCSQLGRESQAILHVDPRERPDLFNSDVEDELLLPSNWDKSTNGVLELHWLPPNEDQTRRKKQVLRMLSCVPIVIIPTDTVPIDYALFFVSPFHPNYTTMTQNVPAHATQGFDWRPDDDDEDGVTLAYDAFRPRGGAASQENQDA